MHLICTRENPAELQPVLGRFGSGVSRRRARAALGPCAMARPRGAAARRSVYTSHITFQPDAPHTLHARPTPLHEQKARTRAHCTCTTAAHALAFSADCSGRLTPSCGPLTASIALTRTDSRRISPPREAPRLPPLLPPLPPSSRRCRRAARHYACYDRRRRPYL